MCTQCLLRECLIPLKLHDSAGDRHHPSKIGTPKRCLPADQALIETTVEQLSQDRCRLRSWGWGDMQRHTIFYVHMLQRPELSQFHCHLSVRPTFKLHYTYGLTLKKLCSPCVRRVTQRVHDDEPTIKPKQGGKIDMLAIKKAICSC